MTWLLLGLLAGFLVGCCYEGCRRGGTVDLHRQLAQQPSNVRVLR